MAARKGSFGWTKFNGITYTPLGLQSFSRRKTAEQIAKCLKSKGRISGYRILKAQQPFIDSESGYIIYVKGKFGHMGHLNEHVRLCR